MKISLETTELDVKKWFEGIPILFGHVALRITLDGQSCYRDFVFCNSDNFNKYIIESDGHFSTHCSLVHWQKTPPEAENLLTTPPIIEVGQQNDVGKQNQPCWNIVHRTCSTFPGEGIESSQQKEALNDKEVRRKNYRSILANNFPVLVDHPLCALGFARIAPYGEDGGDQATSSEPTGYALAIYYVPQDMRTDSTLARKLIQRGIVHLISELVRCIAVTDDNLRRVGRESALKATAFKAARESHKALDEVRKTIKELRTKIDISMYSSSHVLWNRDFIIEHALKDKPWYVDDSPHRESLLKSLVKFASHGLDNPSEGDLRDCLIKAGDPLGRYSIKLIDDSAENGLKQLCELLDSSVAIAMGSHEEKKAFSINPRVLLLPIILSECEPKVANEMLLSLTINDPERLLPPALTYLSTLFLELREKKLLMNNGICFTQSTEGNNFEAEYSFAPTEIFIQDSFKKAFPTEAEPPAQGRLASLRAHLLRDSDGLFTSCLSVCNKHDQKDSVTISLRLPS